MKKSTIIIISILFTTALVAKDRTINRVKGDFQDRVKISNIRNGIVYQEQVYTLKKVSTMQSAGKTLNSSDNGITHYTFANGNKFNSKSMILIKFNQDSHVNVEEIASKYHLKFIRKMNSGDYLFENREGDTLRIINTILTDESSRIERISPNLILNVKPL